MGRVLPFQDWKPAPPTAPYGLRGLVRISRRRPRALRADSTPAEVVSIARRQELQLRITPSASGELPASDDPEHKRGPCTEDGAADDDTETAEE